MKFRALLAEFIGTFALIFIGVLAVNNLGTKPMDLLGIAFAHGLAIACLVSATAAISGGHLNPAVTFGLLIARRVNVLTAIGYWIAQCLGGIAAGYAAIYVTLEGNSGVAKFATPALADAITQPQGIVAEAIATFFLVFVVLGTAVDRRAPKVGGLFIGLSITMGILAIGPITGGALNPARWLGSGVPGHMLENPVVYVAGPLLGALLAGLIYDLFLDDKAPIPPSDPIRVDTQAV